MAHEPTWPAYAEYAAMGVTDDPLDVDTVIGTFAQTFGGLDQAALVRALAVGGPEEQIFAVRALGAADLPDARDLLNPLLKAPEPLVRWEATLGLALMGERSVVPGLCDMLTEFLPPQLTNYLAGGISEYDDRRGNVPTLLADLGDQGAIPCLRHALLQVLRLVSESASIQAAAIVDLSRLPSVREEMPIHDIDGVMRAARGAGTREVSWPADQPPSKSSARGTTDNEGALLGMLFVYLDDIVYALGRLGGIGALTGVQAPELLVRLWTVHLVMGYLHGRVMAGELQMPLNAREFAGAVGAEVRPLLQRFFGLDPDEQTQALTLYSLTKASSLSLHIRRIRRGLAQQ